MDITRTLVINDLHIPFENKPLVDLVLHAAKDINVNRIIINGDLLDFYNLSMHGPAHPDVSFSLEDEFHAGNEFLIKLRKMFPTQHIVFLYGNHCDRLDRFIIKNSKQFYNMLTVENMLYLDNLKIEYYHYNHCYRVDETNLYIQHSPPSYGQNGARTSLLTKMDASFIYGCTHRKQVACITGHSGEIYTCYFNGWLGSITASPEHARVFSYAKGHQNWQSTASIVTVIDKKRFFVDQLDINGGSFILDGNLYEI
jgi:hypothetical protein